MTDPGRYPITYNSILDDAKRVIETWDVLRKANREFSQMDMRRFVETMNDRTRQLIRLFMSTDPTFYQGIADRATNVITFLADDNLAMSDKERTQARSYIAAWEVMDSDFYTALMELCVHATTMVTPHTKVIADGIDRTDV
jgi:hypothetical protein